MDDNFCPHCGLNFSKKDNWWIAINVNDMVCHACGTGYSLMAMAIYVGDAPAGETTVHNFKLSYPYVCKCGYVHEIIAIFCHPVDITKQLSEIKSKINDPNQSNLE